MSILPRVSVVIPLYNHERYIRDALSSVLFQTLSPHEIIVIDDGSTDASLAVVAEIAATDPRIIYWRQDNQDAPQTINNGIRSATGDIIAVLNSDDTYAPERLADCVGALLHDTEIDAVFTGLNFMDDDGKPAACEGFETLLDFYRESDNLPLSLLHGNFFVSTSNLVARKSVFEEIGYFSPLRYAHDLDFYLRMVRAGKKIRFLETPLLWYRIHGGNTIRENRTRAFLELAAIAAVHADFILAAHADKKDGWSEFDRLLQVCDQQGISQCMLTCLWYIQQISPKPLDSAFFLTDAPFQEYIGERIRLDIADKMVYENMKVEIGMVSNKLLEQQQATQILASQLASMESSLSWKITRPLRSLASFLIRHKIWGGL